MPSGYLSALGMGSDPNQLYTTSGRSSNGAGGTPASSTGSSSGGTGGFNAYDQYSYLQNKFPGFNLNRSNGGTQDQVQGTPITQFGRPINSAPTFSDVLSPIYNPITADNSAIPKNPTLQGGQQFQQANQLLSGNYLNSPEVQQTLGNLNLQDAVSRAAAVSGAESLAAKRGISGSSTEQFGVGQANLNSDLALNSARNQVLLQALQQTAANRSQASSQLYGQGTQQGALGTDIINQQYGQANTLAGLNAGRLGLASQLTSDQVASNTNVDQAGQNRALQLELGQAGIDLGYTNAGIAQKNADAANDPFNKLIGGFSQGIGQGVGSSSMF